MKKLLTVALLALSPIALLGDFLDDDLDYVFESGSTTQVRVYNVRNGYATHITIPSTVVYEYTDNDRDDDGNYIIKHRTCTVTSIRDSAFYGCSSLTSVTIPDSVTSIGYSAFNDCSSLTSVTIPDSVTSIGGAAFLNCSSLASVTIGNGVTSIGSSAFDGCRSLTSVTIGTGVTSIMDAAFYGCSGLTSVTIPDSVTSIGYQAFYGCSGLTSVTIPDGVTSIGDYAFCGCSGLTSVTIPDSVTSIGWGAFQDCSSLTSVTIGNGVTSIDSSTFFGCSGLTSVTIGTGVTNIIGYFSDCSAITNVVIPQCVCATNLSAYFPSWQSIKNIRIADGVGYIADYAFANCTGLETVTIPESVTRIGKGVFSDCNNLRRVVFLGDAPDIIGDDVFAATRRSMTVSVPKGSIGWDGGFSEELPEAWNGKQIAHFESDYPDIGSYNSGTFGYGASVCLTVTNVTMHYVTASVPSSAVIPPTTSGIVSIVSEVKAGSAVAIAEEWAAQYPDFTAKFGSDFAAAITKPTGKLDGEGKPMMVWQDFVAGTDPTNPDDVFTASITFDKDTNTPIISWTPELPAAEAAKRSYKTFGKVRLNDPDWTLVDGDADHYNFFKVTVEMP